MEEKVENLWAWRSPLRTFGRFGSNNRAAHFDRRCLACTNNSGLAEDDACGPADAALDVSLLSPSRFTRCRFFAGGDASDEDGWEDLESASLDDDMGDAAPSDDDDDDIDKSLSLFSVFFWAFGEIFLSLSPLPPSPPPPPAPRPTVLSVFVLRRFRGILLRHWLLLVFRFSDVVLCGCLLLFVGCELSKIQKKELN